MFVVQPQDLKRNFAPHFSSLRCPKGEVVLQPSRTCQLGLQPPAQRNKPEPGGKDGGKDKTLKSGDAETLKLSFASAENVSFEGT